MCLVPVRHAAVDAGVLVEGGLAQEGVGLVGGEAQRGEQLAALHEIRDEHAFGGCASEAAEEREELFLVVAEFRERIAQGKVRDGLFRVAILVGGVRGHEGKGECFVATVLDEVEEDAFGHAELLDPLGEVQFDAIGPCGDFRAIARLEIPEDHMQPCGIHILGAQAEGAGVQERLGGLVLERDLYALAGKLEFRHAREAL